MTSQVLVLNGPNLARLGSREPEIYGTATLDDVAAACAGIGGQLGLTVDVRQTDDEAELIGWVHQAADQRLPIVLNPAAFTHYSYALRDALAMRTAPLIEVHLSNPATREPFRHNSVVAGVADGTMAGLACCPTSWPCGPWPRCWPSGPRSPARPAVTIQPFIPNKAALGHPALPGGTRPGRKGLRRMRIGMALNYAGGFAETAAELADYEKAGLDIVFVPEAYSFDAVSQLGYLAARTERVQLASGILQIYSRTPALTAMTAAGLDYVSGGRFVLGLGRLRPAGHRGLARRALRRPRRPHPRADRDLPHGLAPRAPGVRRPPLHRSRSRPTRAPAWASPSS